MTTLNDATEAIYLRLDANFSGVTDDRICLENEEFDEPESGEWVKIVVRVTGRNQNTMGKIGNRRYRTKAILYAQVFTGIDTGVQTSQNLLKLIADIFEGVSFSGLDFTDATQRNGDASGKWKMSFVEAEFDFDEIK
jgi:hypothetical protein